MAVNDTESTWSTSAFENRQHCFHECILLQLTKNDTRVKHAGTSAGGKEVCHMQGSLRCQSSTVPRAWGSQYAKNANACTTLGIM